MLEVQNLRKQYGTFAAVKGISFQLSPGQIMGFIGSNGAGKTTTIKMLACLLEPTSGTASLNGLSLNHDTLETRKRIGYMPDFFGLYEDVKVWEYLDMFGTIYGVPAADRPRVIDEVLELTDLGFKKDAYAKALSRGMQQRLCLARCLIHNPDLLLLDEPASGLDPRARAELKELILELGRMGKIVIVSSHILPELADFCSVIGIIERGDLLAFGSLEDVTRSFESTRILEITLLSRAAEASMSLHNKPGILDTRMLGSESFAVEFEGTPEEQAELLERLIDQGYKVVEFREESADLEDLFMKVTTGALN